MLTRTGSNPKRLFRIAIALIMLLSAFSSAIPVLSGEISAPAASAPAYDTFAPVDVFDEYFDYVKAVPSDENGNGKNDTVRIYFDVDTEGAKENVEVFIDVFNSSSTLIGTYSKSLLVVGDLDFDEDFFDYFARYADHYNFSLRLYDVTHSKKENNGNNYEIPQIWLDPYKGGYELFVTATPVMRDSRVFNDDVMVSVKDSFGHFRSGVEVYIDASLKGTTDENGTLYSLNYDRGFHEVDVFLHRVHANTDFKSEGNGIPEPILVDSDPQDFEGVGVLNDVTITAMRENSVPIRNAEVQIDGEFYGTTNVLGTLDSWNHDEGFHYVNVQGKNQWHGSVFYSEAMRGPADYDEFFNWADAGDGNFDNGEITNDIEVLFSLGIEGVEISNVTVNATLMHLNETVIATTSGQFTAFPFGFNPGDALYFYNLSKDSYRILLELYDEQWKLEDAWWIEVVTVNHAKSIINVDRGARSFDNFGTLNDVFFYSHIMEDVYSDGYILMNYSSNGTVYSNLSMNEEGYNTVMNIPIGGYEFTAYDNNAKILDSGEFTIYPSIIIDIQTSEMLTDDDFDGYYDDFRVEAYDDSDNNINTVYVYIWDDSNNVFKEGYTSALTPGGPGVYSVRNIPEGNYTYQTRTTAIPQRIFANGTFYSYGNDSEASTRINVYAAVKDINSNGKNDVVVKVTDFADQGVPGARVYFDRDMTYYESTDSNGEVTAYDFAYGWHHVDVYKVAGRPKGHAYTQFFSEGLEYDIYFDFVTAYQSDADEDGDVNDLTVYAEVDLFEDIDTQVTVTATLFYQGNGSYYAKNYITYVTADQWFDPVFFHFYDLPYNETFNATFRLYNSQGELEDVWNQSDITIERIGLMVNVDFYYQALLGREVDQTGITNYPLIGFHAHRDMVNINNVTIRVYNASDDSLAYEAATDNDGFVTIDDPQFDYRKYYWKAYNNTGSALEVDNEFTGDLNLSWYSFNLDYDEDGYWDDYVVYTEWSEVNRLGQAIYTLVNATVKFYDANLQLITSGFTDPEPSFMILNLTQGKYYYSTTYENKIYDYGEFHINNNGYDNQAPHVEISSPADDSDFFDIDTITFDGTSSSDPDTYDRLIYDWRSDISGFLSDQPSFSSSLSPGKHTITLTVDDAHGHKNSTSIILNIQSFAQPNAAPRAVISSPAENDKFFKSDMIFFDGANSTDEVPGNLTFMWVSNVTDTLNGNSSQFFMSLPSGAHQITLTVDDGGGLNSTDVVNITVDNRAPTANLSSPGDGNQYNASDSILFSAEGSSDPDGNTTLSFLWESNLTGVIGSTKSFSRTLSGGVHQINLTVSDGEFNDTAFVTITVVNTPPVANITQPVEGWTYFKGAMFFDGSASLDADGETIFFYWELDGAAAAGNVSSFSTNVTDLGLHTIKLFVTDGLVNVSATVNFTIENQAPVAIAGPDVTININSEVEFNASFSYDPDGDDISYIWDFDASDGTNQIDGNGMVVIHTYTLSGDFEVTLTVNDGSVDNNTAKNNLTVHVNRGPDAKAGPDVTADINEVINFSASGSSDLDGDPLSYSWDFGDGFTGSSENTSHSYSTEGTYTVSLNVSDFYAWDTDTLKVTILKQNQEPRARAGADMVVNRSSAVHFNGSASSDPDGDQLFYIWDFDDTDGTDDEDALGMVVTHTFNDFGDFKVTLTVEDGNGGRDNDSLVLTVNAPPVIDVTEVEDAFVGEKITFDASGTEDPENHQLTFTWDFGDETDPQIGDTVTKTYVEDDTFTVSLTVRDFYFASSTYEFDITIKPIPVPEITKPGDGNTVNGLVTIQGSADLDIVKKVQIYIFSGTNPGSPDNTAVVSSDNSWTFQWNSEGVKNGVYNIEVRGTTEDGKYRSDARRISVTVENEEIIDGNGDGNKTDTGEPDEGIFDFVNALGTTVLAVCCVAGIIVIVVIIAYMVRRPGRGKRAPEAAIRAAQMDMYKQVEESAAQEESFEEIEEDEKEDEGTKRPIKCPSCGDIFVTKDTGERPWLLWCTQCGAKGIIKDDSKLKLPPAEDERRKEEAKKEEKAKREKVKCPECTEIFSVWSDEREIECPNCGVIGER